MRDKVALGIVLLLLVAGVVGPATAADPDTLVIALDTLGAQVMDPIADTRAPHAHYHAPVWDSLVGFDFEKGGIGPGVAERWERAADGRSWTFYLRKGQRFHNGDPLTAHDVKFSLERIMLPESISSGAAALRRAVDRIDVVDDLTVRVHTKGVIPHFAASLSRAVFMEGTVMPKKYIEAVGTKGFREKPVGSGPWKFVRSVPGDRIEYEAVNYPHWRGTPQFKRMTLLLVPEQSTRLAMVRTGEAGIASIGPDGINEDRECAGDDAGHLSVLGHVPSGGEGPTAHGRTRARGAVAGHRPAAAHRPRHGERGALAAALHDVPVLHRRRRPALGSLGQDGVPLRPGTGEAAPR
jgi:peptide/nickel transport system substrate-binding protein